MYVIFQNNKRRHIKTYNKNIYFNHNIARFITQSIQQVDELKNDVLGGEIAHNGNMFGVLIL